MAKGFGESKAEKASQGQQAYLVLIIELLNCRSGSTSGAEFQEVLNAYQELVTPELLEVMAQEAESLRDKKKWDQANSLLSLALQVGEVLGSSEREAVVRQETADVLSQMGRREREISQFSEAVQFSELSLTIYRELSDSQGEVEALNSLGKGCRCLGEKERAIALHQESLAIAREIGYSQGEVDALNSLGAMDNSLGKHEEAKAYHQEALSIAEAIGYAKGKADAFNGLGLVYRSLGKYEEAIADHQECLAIDREIKDSWGECASFYNLAINYRSLQQYEQSLECQQESLVAAREIKNRQWESYSLETLGSTYRSLGEYEKAIEFYQQRLTISRELKDLKGEDDSVTDLGLAYNSLKQYERAIEFWQRRLEIKRELKDGQGEARTLGLLGEMYDSLGQYEQAVEFHQQCLTICRELKDTQGAVSSLDDLGAAYSSLVKQLKVEGNHKAAAENLELEIAAYQNALLVRTKEAFPNEWAVTQNNLGAAYIDRIKGDKAENLEMAIAAFQNALEIYTKDGFPNDWAATQNDLGVAYIERIKGDRAENLELAIAAYQNAFLVRTKEAFPKDWANTQINLGNAYRERIKRDRTENLELAIAAFENALEIYTKAVFPNYWADTQNNLGAVYRERIKGDRTENLEMAIAAFQNALLVRTKDDFPNYWADTQNNLGAAYIDRIKGDRAENLELAIAAYQNTLEVYTPKANPLECLRTSSSLGNLHFLEGNWQSAIDAYKQTITAVELSRSWSQDDDRRQDILQEAIGAYVYIVQCFVNLQQYSQGFAYAERSRSRQLVDLMASKDLYHKGEITLEAEELLQQFESLERQIDRLRFPNQSPDNRETTDAATANRQRAAWGATNEAIVKLEVEKQEVYRHIRKFDRVLAEGIKVEPLDFACLEQLIEDDTTAILSFYSTINDTYAFIVRRSGVDVHTCQGQGIGELQEWLRNNWLRPYSEISYLPGFIAAAQLLGCEVEAIESWKLGNTEVTVILEDGNSHTVDKTKFRELRKQEKERLDNEWYQQMPGKFAEISRRLQLDKLVEKLEGIQELILIPHLYLHQIPFAALPVADNHYFGDKFLIRTQASCQVLDFCHQRPPLATNSPTYGIVENTTQDLYYSSYEGRQVAEMYQVADSQYLKGSEGTVNEYKKLLPQVQRLLSTHHAQSRLDNNLESALILADGRITLGQLLSPAFRFPDLDEVFLSCCETNLGSTDISDNMMTLNTGFLCAGARGAVSSLWSVDDLATSLFSVFYHQLRQAGKNRPQALQLAQQKLRQLTGKEFEAQYGKEIKKALTEKSNEAWKRFRETRKQQKSYPKDSPEYKECLKESAKQMNICEDIEAKIKNLQEKSKKEHPFAHPIYWSGFICAGLRG